VSFQSWKIDLPAGTEGCDQGGHDARQLQHDRSFRIKQYPSN
jgi:hypothetical protein